MKELQIDEIEHVSGGWDLGAHVTTQATVIGTGIALATNSMVLTPVGALVFIGVSIASTIAYIGGQTSGGGSTKKLIETSEKKQD